MKSVQIVHRTSGEVLADGPLGWGITPFEGNFYISRKYLKTDRLKVNFLPGLCIYKFMYVWMDLKLVHGERIRNLAWMYWLQHTRRSKLKSTDRCIVTDTEKTTRLPSAKTVVRLPAPIVVRIRGRESPVVGLAQTHCDKHDN